MEARMKERRFLGNGVRFVLVLVSLCHVQAVPPEQMPAPTVISIQATSINISFAFINNATKYLITATPRHSGSIVTAESTATTANIVNLSESTLYDITVRAQNAAGETGVDGNATSAQTNPGAPTVTWSTPLPHSVFIFLRTPNYARVSQWEIQFSHSNETFTNTTPSGQYYGYWFTGFPPSTTVQIRARALQLYGTTSLTQELFSPWQNFTTDSLSVFGRTDIVNSNYTNNTRNSEDWDNALQIIRTAYSNVSTESIDIVQLENSTVHYQIKVSDSALPSPTNYLLNGTQFANSAINNGGQPVGVTRLANPTTNVWLLQYNPIDNVSSPEGTANKYMIVTAEDQSTIEFDLTLPNSEGSGLKDDDALKVEEPNWFDQANNVIGAVSDNTLYGLVPKFLIKDFDRETEMELLYHLSYDANEERNIHDFYTTRLTPNVNTSTYTSSSDGTSVTMNIPAVSKATKYEILNGSSVLATLEEADIDGSSNLKLMVPSLSSGTVYNLTLKVTTREQYGTTTSATSTNAITVIPSPNQCASCAPNASCETDSAGDVTCTCDTGFEGNGTVCSATSQAPTTQPTTVAEPTTTPELTTITEPTTQTTTTLEPAPSTMAPEVITITVEQTNQTMTPETVIITDEPAAQTTTPQVTILTDEPTTQTTRTPEPATQTTTPELIIFTDEQTNQTMTPESVITTDEPATETPTPEVIIITDEATTETKSTPEPDAQTTTPKLIIITDETTNQTMTPESIINTDEPATQSTTPEVIIITDEPTTQTTTTPEPAAQTTTPEVIIITDEPATQTTSTPEPAAQTTTPEVIIITDEPTTQTTTTPEPAAQTMTPEVIIITDEPATQTTSTPEPAAQTTTPEVIIITDEPATQATEPATQTTTPRLMVVTDEPTTPATTQESVITSAATKETTTLSPDCAFVSVRNASFIPQQAEANSTSFKLIWASIASATDYIINITCDGCGEPDRVETSSVSELTLSGLTPGQIYTACVTAGLCIDGKVKNEKQCNTFPTTPPGVTEVNIAVGSTSITLTWKAAKGAASYIVAISFISGRKKRALTEFTETVYGTSTTIGDLRPNGRYSFAVTAQNSAGQSEPYRGSFNTASPTVPSVSNTSTIQSSRTVETTLPDEPFPTRERSTIQSPRKEETTLPDEPFPTRESTTTILPNTAAFSALPNATEPKRPPTTYLVTFISSTGQPSPPYDTSIISTDMTSSTLSAPTSAVSTTTAPSIKTTAVDKIPYGGVPWWFIFSIVLAVLIIIACIGGIVWYFRKGKKYVISGRTAV